MEFRSCGSCLKFVSKKVMGLSPKGSPFGNNPSLPCRHLLLDAASFRSEQNSERNRIEDISADGCVVRNRFRLRTLRRDSMGISYISPHKNVKIAWLELCLRTKISGYTIPIYFVESIYPSMLRLPDNPSPILRRKGSGEMGPSKWH